MDLLKRVFFDEDYLVFELSDGRLLATPLTWFPKLLEANDDQRSAFELSPFGAHWADLDEDISLEGILHGASPNRWDTYTKNELLGALERLEKDGVIEENG